MNPTTVTALISVAAEAIKLYRELSASPGHGLTDRQIAELAVERWRTASERWKALRAENQD